MINDQCSMLNANCCMSADQGKNGDVEELKLINDVQRRSFPFGEADGGWGQVNSDMNVQVPIAIGSDARDGDKINKSWEHKY
jgi:hypothetical protein